MILPGKRTRQPQQLPRINWANPITRGLAFAYVNGVSARGFNKAGAPSIPYIAGSVLATSPAGTGARSASSSARLFSTGPTGIVGTSYSLLAVGTGPASGTQNAIDDDDAASSRKFQFRLNDGTAQFITFDSAGFLNGNISTPAISATKLATGFVIGASASPTDISVYANGARTTATSSGPAAPTGNFFIGGFKGGGQGWSSGALNMEAGWTRTLSDAEHKSLADNPWQIWMPEARLLAVDVAGAVGTNLTPGEGGLVLAGFAPTIAQPHDTSPGQAALSITGYAPSVSQAVLLSPAPGALALTGYAPTVAQPKTLTPPAAALTLTGYAPTITQSSSLTPAAAAQVITGYAPAVTQPKTLTPGAGALTIAGFAPTVSQSLLLSPTPGALVITGRAPTISQPRTVAPAAAPLALTGYAPSISQVYIAEANEFYTTIMRASTVTADAGAPSSNIMVQSPLVAAYDLSTIMRASTVNVSGTMAANPINLTGNLL